MIRVHDDRKGTFAGARSFSCAAELANHLLDERKDRSTFAPTNQEIGLCNLTACTEACPAPVEIAESAFIARLGRVADGTRGA